MSRAPQARSLEREIFLEALDQPTPERAAFLDRACAGDSALRAAVESLLAHHRDDNFLEVPRASAPASATTGKDSACGSVPLHPQVREQPGDRIGRYKLLQVIGEGGGGTVFMAEQEEPVRRRVALKIIKPGMDTRSVVARFESERQALALMDHPNIARVLDGGETASGRPYFVMELVRGVRLTEYCDQHRLPTPDRLRLFITVCQAIQHAHQKGIIHRDIKPSNILVTLHDGVPLPKVIDFGIAKAIDQRLTDKTVFTEFQAFIGTPAYMSPEQAEMSSLDIDTRSDVYSLGVLLYELLTGRTPFDPGALLSAGLDGMRRTLREEEPMAPSTRIASLAGSEQTTTASRHQAEPARLVSVLRGDLDWIVLKALEKDRTRRYESASDLAADVRRFLDFEPVTARPPSTWYRFQKLVLRNRLAFTAAGAFATALILGLALASWQFVEKSQAYQKVVAAELEQRLLTQEARRAQTNEARLRLAAQAQERQARKGAYAADMNLAAVALGMDNLGRAQELLGRHRPVSSAPDLRGWEWRYLWQQTQSDALFTLCRRSNEVHALSVSPEGRWVAVGDRGGVLSVWDLRTRENAAEFGGIGMGDRVFEFSPTASVLAFATRPGRPGPQDAAQFVRLWDAGGRRFVGQFELEGACQGLAFSPDGLSLITADSSGQVIRWSLPDGTAMQRLKLARMPRFGLAVKFSRDLRLAAVREEGGRVRVIDLETGLERWNARAAEEDVKAMAFSPDGSLLATGAGFVESSIRLWDVATGVEIRRLEGHRTWVSALIFWPEGDMLASASGDQTIRLWNLRRSGSDGGPAREPTILRGHQLEVWSLALLPDHTTLISGCKDGTVCVWDTSVLRRDRSHLTLPKPVRAWVFANDSRSILAVDERGQVVRWQGPELQDGQPELSVGEPSFGVDFSWDARFALVAPEPGRLRLWDLGTRTVIRDWGTASSRLLSLGFLSISNRLVTYRWEEGVIEEWDLASEEPRRSWRTEGGPGIRLPPVFSPDGQWLISSGTEGRGILRSTSNGDEWSIDLPPLLRGQAAFSPDGRLVAGVGGLGTGGLWETATGRRCGTINGFLQGLHSVTFSPDGRRLAIGSNGREAVKIWDTDPPQELLTLEGGGSRFGDVAFSPDGNVLGSRNAQNILHLWRAPSFEEIAREEVAGGP